MPRRRRSCGVPPARSGDGAALALRPKRRGTPPRTAPVIQTQIILAVVGAVIMLVIGASLARAFGIVGAANLIRYRSKIDDPKDAVVMLCTLAVGLATGVGLWWSANGTFDRLDQECAPACEMSSWSGARDRERAGVALGVGGAAVAALGAVLWWSGTF